jgi:hypothetical protein
MREAPFLLIGEGTSEIQKMIISRGLLREYKILKSIVPNGPARLSSRPFPWAASATAYDQRSTGPRPLSCDPSPWAGPPIR